MRNIILGTLFLAAVIFSGLWFHQAHKTRRSQARADGLQEEVAKLQSSLAEQEKQTTGLQEQLEDLSNAAAAKNQELGQLSAKLTNQLSSAVATTTGSTNSKFSNLLADMFNTPEMMDMLKGQLSPMVEKNYRKLFADLHLSPEQASALKDMILNKQLGGAQMGVSMVSGEGNTGQSPVLFEQVKAAGDTADAQIKEFLGDENFAKFQAYEKTLGERMAISEFKDQLSGGPATLTDEQEQQLIQLMTQERQNFKFTTDLSDESKLTGDPASMFTEDKMKTYFQELEQLDQQYQSRAQAILSPDQLTAFAKYLHDQQALQKVGMQMAVKMFAPGNPGGK